MRSLLLLPYYIRWHYGEALRNVVAIAGDFAAFMWHLFSINLLLRTFFTPWQRLHEERGRGLDFSAIFSALAVNTIMRLVGVIIRTIFILIGLASMVVVVVLACAFMVLWLAFPLVFVMALVFGFTLIFRNI